MKELVQKVSQIEREIHDEKGGFALFALLLRRDAEDRWDLVIAARWIDADRKQGIEYLAQKLEAALEESDVVKIDRIVALSVDNEAIQKLQDDFHAKGMANGHGVATMYRVEGKAQVVRNIDFSRQDILVGYVFALNTEGKTIPLPSGIADAD